LDRSSPLGSQVSAACALVRQSRVLRSSVVITRLNLRGDCVSGRALQCSARSIGACPQNRRNGARDCLVVRIGSLTNPLLLMGRSPFTGARSFFPWSAAVQQRDMTLRLIITRLLPGASSMAISPRPSASLMTARVLALPMLARSAICAALQRTCPRYSSSQSTAASRSRTIRL
jgi:hypothetical protein